MCSINIFGSSIVGKLISHTLDSLDEKIAPIVQVSRGDYQVEFYSLCKTVENKLNFCKFIIKINKIQYINNLSAN